MSEAIDRPPQEAVEAVQDAGAGRAYGQKGASINPFAAKLVRTD